MRILVADDDKVISMMVCAILRQEGYEPIAAFDQMQALMFAMKAPCPDAIVLDLNMPGGAGIETLRKLRNSARTMQIPVIVLSGNVDRTTPDMVKALGANAFISKPVQREQLLGELRRHTGPGSQAAPAPDTLRSSPDVRLVR